MQQLYHPTKNSISIFYILTFIFRQTHGRLSIYHHHPLFLKRLMFVKKKNGKEKE